MKTIAFLLVCLWAVPSLAEPPTVIRAPMNGRIEFVVDYEALAKNWETAFAVLSPQIERRVTVVRDGESLQLTQATALEASGQLVIISRSLSGNRQVRTIVRADEVLAVSEVDAKDAQ